MLVNEYKDCGDLKECTCYIECIMRSFRAHFFVSIALTAPRRKYETNKSLKNPAYCNACVDVNLYACRMQ